MLLIALVISIFLIAPFAPWLQRRTGASWILSLWPAVLFVWLAVQTKVASGAGVVEAVSAWVPSLGIVFAMRLDGLSWLFALLITGIGAVVIVYSHHYLKNDHSLGRFQTYILLFMGSMLGLVLADDVITMFVFWELTSATSYLLIGFKHDDDKARYGALKALLITGAGGLALLFGLLLMGKVAGTFRLSELLSQGELLRSHSLYLPILLLVCAGAFTKSAQVPFHIWLPDAMQAPTPASSYLHSATMVKAGIYLLARLHIALGGTDIWVYVVGVAGLVTMLLGAFLAFKQKDLKALLAYSTISALGLIVALIGLGTPLAMKAAMIGILAHALYKGTLFLVAGIIDHATGTRDLNQLGGLFRKMPITTLIATVAALSMAGIPPLIGFFSKEVFFEAMLEQRSDSILEWLIPLFALITAILAVAYSILFIHGAFLGQKKYTPKAPHEGSWGILIGPGILATLSLFLGWPFFRDFSAIVIGSSSGAVLGKAIEIKLKLWHGFNEPFLMSIGAVLGGSLIYVLRHPFWRLQEAWPKQIKLSAIYDFGLVGLNHLAVGLTRKLQTGTLRHYLMIIVVTLLGLIYFVLLRNGVNLGIAFPLDGVRFYEFFAAVVMAFAALVVVKSSSRLGAIAALGTVGYLMALFYVFYSGPDLALTQLLVETLAVLLLLLVFYFLSRFFEDRSTKRSRMRDALIAAGFGATITLLVLMALPLEISPSISDYFLENSLPLAYGANVVNVILVDFRALDTMGEITVLVIAALSAYGLIKLRAQSTDKKAEKIE